MVQPRMTKRFLTEMERVKEDNMTSMGIHYYMNEANAYNGMAMIIGPENTPYAHCPLVFSIDFPGDYPQSNPSVKFLTSDGTTRFHPNLYVAGKVCLSILGTWKGPSWTAAMTISTVLTSIQSLLEANPIVNEPGWEEYTLENPRAKGYADYVKYRIVALSYRNLKAWKNGITPHDWKYFEDVLEEKGDELLEKLEEIIRENAAKDECVYSELPYGMSGKTEWKRIPVGAVAVKLPESRATLKESGK
jgi:ubiquitin-protein ligase